MLDFSDQPYVDFPPRYSRFWAAVLLWFNRRRHLPHTLRVERVEVSGLDGLAAARRPGDRLLLLPNHPTHADAPIFYEALRQAGIRSHVMAAYDVFLRRRIDAWVMQRLGAFSVDREGSDQRAMKRAMQVLGEGRFALTIFPEGNVYLENDRVTPFNEGAAFLAVRALSAEADASAVDRRVLAVPVAIKVTHTTDVRAALRQRVADLARELGLNVQVQDPPLEAMRTVGLAALRRNLRQRGLEPPDESELRPTIERAAGAVLAALERKLEIEPRPRETLHDRVRKCRRVIHETRTDPQRHVDHAVATTWADEAMLAYRILSYSGQYVAERGTIDRYAETIEKLAEDLYRRMMPPVGPRAAFVRFQEPIDVGGYIGEARRTREAVRALTAACESSVQAGLDELNRQNPHHGGRLWQDSDA